MLCVYVDDAGSSGARIRTPTQPYQYMGALLVPDDRWIRIRDALNVQANDAGRADAEYHGAELYNGQGDWKGLDPKRRIEIYALALGLLRDEDLTVVLGRCEKALLLKYRSPMDPRLVAFWMCLESIADHCNSMGQLAFIVADDSRDKESRRIPRELLEQYREHGPPFGSKVDISRIIDTVHFMDSAQSRHLQLCDLALYAIRRAENLGAGVKDETGLSQIVGARVGTYRTFPYRR